MSCSTYCHDPSFLTSLLNIIVKNLDMFSKLQLTPLIYFVLFTATCCHSHCPQSSKYLLILILDSLPKHQNLYVFL